MSCLPNLFLIGAQKAATSSLHYYLNQHPQICMSRPLKEPMFFVHGLDFPGARNIPERNRYKKGMPLDRPPPQGFSCVTIEDYLSLFEHKPDAPIRGESSTAYLAAPAGAVANISRLIHDPFILASIRHPVDRAMSAYAFAVRLGIEGRSFAQALEEELNGNIGHISHMQRYIALSINSPGLRLYLHTFGPQRCLFFRYERISRDPALWREITEFLGVEGFDFNVSRRLNTREDDAGEHVIFSDEDKEFCSRILAKEVEELSRIVI